MGQSKHISIIDDDYAVREATKGLLRSLGYTAVTFDSAESFLSSNELLETSCIITDVRMPGMGGLGLQNFLIENGYTLPILFITAFPDDQTRKLVLDAGASGYLVKPCDQNRLITFIEQSSQR
ncbi:MAG: response regulator [Pseudorhodoplanes sp.]|nr:response regulator [Pseudorhodoplanes sp.]